MRNSLILKDLIDFCAHRLKKVCCQNPDKEFEKITFLFDGERFVDKDLSAEFIDFEGSV